MPRYGSGAKLPDAGKTPRSGVAILCHTEITMTTPVPIAKTTCLVLALGSAMLAQNPRGRALGIPFDGTSGPNNAITDVAGIAVGHTTLIRGEGKLVPGQGPVRTGVTAILPRPKEQLGFRDGRNVQPERQW